jgi:hypothetical protein
MEIANQITTLWARSRLLRHLGLAGKTPGGPYQGAHASAREEIGNGRNTLIGGSGVHGMASDFFEAACF